MMRKGSLAFRDAHDMVEVDGRGVKRGGLIASIIEIVVCGRTTSLGSLVRFLGQRRGIVTSLDTCRTLMERTRIRA